LSSANCRPLSPARAWKNLLWPSAPAPSSTR
jgi:hypothetical protein